MIVFQSSHILPEDAAFIRKAVFVDEQGFRSEFDGCDGSALHTVLYQDEKPVATCRLLWNPERQSYMVGRIAVLKEYRGKGFGAAILSEAERQTVGLAGKQLCLAAQLRARGFYEKQGYSAVGEVFLEEDCPHIWMYKRLTE